MRNLLTFPPTARKPESAGVLLMRDWLPQLATASAVRPATVRSAASARPCRIDRLAGLPQALGLHRPLVALGREARLVPVQSAKGNEPTGLRLAVGDEGFVLNLGEAIRWQRAPPMLHQPLVLTVG